MNRQGRRDGANAVENQAALTKSADHRRHPRRLTLLTGRIAAGDRFIDCAILDLSPAGARILVPKGAETPDVFELVIDPDGLRLQCRLIWADGDTQGLAFIAGTLSEPILSTLTLV